MKIGQTPSSSQKAAAFLFIVACSWLAVSTFEQSLHSVVPVPKLQRRDRSRRTRYVSMWKTRTLVLCEYFASSTTIKWPSRTFMEHQVVT